MFIFSPEDYEDEELKQLQFDLKYFLKVWKIFVTTLITFMVLALFL